MRDKRGRPRRYAELALGDRGDADTYRRVARALGVNRLIAGRGTENGSVAVVVEHQDR